MGVCGWVERRGMRATFPRSRQAALHARMRCPPQPHPSAPLNFPTLLSSQVTYHFLQAVFQHVHLTKGAPGAGGAGAGVKQEGGYAGAAPAAGGYAAPAVGGAAGGYNPHGGLTAVQSDVMSFFSAPDAQGDAGISLDDVRALGGGGGAWLEGGAGGGLGWCRQEPPAGCVSTCCRHPTHPPARHPTHPPAHCRTGAGPVRRAVQHGAGAGGGGGAAERGAPVLHHRRKPLQGG